MMEYVVRSHEIMNLEGGTEIAFIFEDTQAKNPSEKYKMLMAEHQL